MKSRDKGKDKEDEKGRPSRTETSIRSKREEQRREPVRRVERKVERRSMSPRGHLRPSRHPDHQHSRSRSPHRRPSSRHRSRSPRRGRDRSPWRHASTVGKLQASRCQVDQSSPSEIFPELWVGVRPLLAHQLKDWSHWSAQNYQQSRTINWTLFCTLHRINLISSHILGVVISACAQGDLFQAN